MAIITPPPPSTVHRSSSTHPIYIRSMAATTAACCAPARVAPPLPQYALHVPGCRRRGAAGALEAGVVWVFGATLALQPGMPRCAVATAGGSGCSGAGCGGCLGARSGGFASTGGRLA